MSKKNKQPKIPYRGLRYFDWTDERDFYGRQYMTDTLIKKLKRQLKSGSPRFLGLIGPSGSGKSSLARAGVIGRLRRSERANVPIRGSHRWPQPAMLQPGSHPVRELAQIVSAFAKECRAPAPSLDELTTRLMQEPTTLSSVVEEIMKDAPDGHHWVLLCDQFEEVFTLCEAEDERKALIHNLYEAACQTDGRVIVLLTLRADFYGQSVLDPKLGALFAQHQLLLQPMTEQELAEAMIQPALRAGVSFEADLVQCLSQEVADQPGALPLLQMSLLELWRQRDGRQLTKKAYLSFGGARGALERRAEDIYGGLTESQKSACRALFLELVQPGIGPEDTKKKASLADLFSTSQSASECLACIEALSDPMARLLTVHGKLPRLQDVASLPSTSPASWHDTQVEVSHEALLVGWERLQSWIKEQREALHVANNLKQAAMQWNKQAGENRDAALWDGPQWALTAEWLERTEHQTLVAGDATTKAFIEACQRRAAFLSEKEERMRDEQVHQLHDRAAILETKVAINERKSSYLKEEEARMKQRQQWLQASVSLVVVVGLVLTWTLIQGF